jgi:hypothetical protein
MLGENITVLTAQTVMDPFSLEEIDDWALTPAARDVYTLAPAEPRPSDEPSQDARNSVTKGWTLYLPPGDPINRRNRVRVRGVVYPVQGQPADWARAGVVVQCFSTEG